MRIAGVSLLLTLVVSLRIYRRTVSNRLCGVKDWNCKSARTEECRLKCEDHCEPTLSAEKYRQCLLSVGKDCYYISEGYSCVTKSHERDETPVLCYLPDPGVLVVAMTQIYVERIRYPVGYSYYFQIGPSPSSELSCEDALFTALVKFSNLSYCTKASLEDDLNLESTTEDYLENSQLVDLTGSDSDGWLFEFKAPPTTSSPDEESVILIPKNQKARERCVPYLRKLIEERIHMIFLSQGVQSLGMLRLNEDW